MKKHLLSGITILLFLNSVNAQVRFISGGWNEALEKAKAENKYIFVDAFTDWCYWCKEMDKKTFPMSTVGDFMNKNFISVKIDMEKDFGVKLAMKYRVASFPTYLVFNSNGQLVDVLNGYQPADKFIAGLKTSLETGKKDGFKGISDKIELDFPSFYVETFKGNQTGKVTKADPKEVAAYLDTQKDLFSEVNWSILTRNLRTQTKYQQFILDNKEKYVKLYGENEVNGAIEKVIGDKLNAAIKSKDEIQLNESLDLVDKYFDPKADLIKTKYSYRIAFYQQSEQWIKMDKILTEGINQFGYEAFNINDYAWSVYEKCMDAAVIKDAITWMKYAIEKDAGYAELDTYAALLYKDKQYVQAEKYATLAIETGKKANEEVKETEGLLELIKKESSK